MANLINIDAEAGANMIGDDSQPTLELSNSGGGLGLDVKGLSVASTASIDVAKIPTLTSTSLTADVTRSVSAAAATITAFRFTGSSIASGAIFALLNNSAFVSTTTIDVTVADQVGGAIRVVKPNGTFGWIPVYTDEQVTAVAV